MVQQGMEEPVLRHLCLCDTRPIVVYQDNCSRLDVERCGALMTENQKKIKLLLLE